MSQRNPFPTVDVVVECSGGIVLVRRKNEPVGWALPGGFVDAGERVEAAAVREIQEETGLTVALETLLYVYSDPSRDPRFHTMTVVFVGQATGTPSGADDAAEARVFALDALPSPIVFDHTQIIADYRRYRSSGERPSPTAALGR
ncbi:MAG: NUDIX hydrolase [Pseudomonadota bacterium]